MPAFFRGSSNWEALTITQEAWPQAAQVGPGGLLHSRSQLLVIPDGEFTGGHSYLKGLDLPFADLLICILGTKPLAKSCGQGLSFLPFCKEEPLSTVSCTTQHPFFIRALQIFMAR